MDALSPGWEMLHGISRFRNNKTQYEMREKTKKDLRDSLPRGFFLCAHSGMTSLAIQPVIPSSQCKAAFAA